MEAFTDTLPIVCNDFKYIFHSNRPKHGRQIFNNNPETGIQKPTYESFTLIISFRRANSAVEIQMRGRHYPIIK